jgi:organic hydroperoxide reductase OsmC/OhrA
MVTLEHEGDYRFRASFGTDAIPSLITDEPPPLGRGEGPNPAMMLAAAVGNCLASSLLFCFRKARIETRGLLVEVATHTGRNAAGRLRIERIDVRLAPGLDESQRPRIGRCLETFEQFCIVTESVRRGIDVRVRVEPVAPRPADDAKRVSEWTGNGTHGVPPAPLVATSPRAGAG